ncbi:sulfite exporter TauE/SafE family protein [Phycicoccus flavus]|uniref:sulfite exporter TauE/SafE family protein n=1 Tax=Phycicoccus flavus TaxID=2502783 RepID=UPI000FEB6629|nr:sulfite exporter TauE/SafE family protein [Phycicoccus flavus]NHA66693.1 sulfite exporter TauE/SafE family protein [Phycicoccus flavus]
MPAELLSSAALAVLVVSFLVGIVVGLTGMGGGALMTPALVFLGIPPSAAVANDLVAAAVNKSVGAAVHARTGSPDWRLARLLVIGSVPFAFAGAFLIRLLGSPEQQEALLKVLIGVALLLAASTYTMRVYGSSFLGWGRGSGEATRGRTVPTVVVGAVGGLLVGLTSVGSGSIIMVALLLLHPGLAARRLVGTDLVQAVPLVLAAAVGHVITSGVDWAVLVPLVVGGTPGTFLGSRLAAWVPGSAIRRGIVIVLTLTGITLLGVPPMVVGAVGAGLLVLGPLAWALLRRAHGLPAFGRDDTDDEPDDDHDHDHDHDGRDRAPGPSGPTAPAVPDERTPR